MKTISEFLVLDDFKNQKRKIFNEIKNIEKYKEEIDKFEFILNDNFKLPMIKREFKNKSMFVDFILYKKQIYLSLNVIFNKKRKIVRIEAISLDKKLTIIRNVRSIRLLTGLKLKKEIDYKDKMSYLVNIIEINKLFPKENDVKPIENSLEEFISKNKIYEIFGLQSGSFNL